MDSVLCTLTGNAYSLLSTCFPRAKMCSVQEAGETQLPRKKSQVGRKCMKCEEGAVAIARTKDPFCKSCFNAYFTHRFRATIGKSRLIRDGEKALLAFSGGINSRVMLALVEEGLSQRVHKKLRFIPTVIHIDEGTVLGLDWKERCRSTAEVIFIAMEVGLPICFTQLEQIFDRYEAHSIEKLLMLELSGSESLQVKKESICNPTPVFAEPNQRTQGEPQNLSQIAEEDKASSNELTKQSLETQGDDVSSKHKLSTDDICSRLESFLEKRDVSAEMKLKELFAAAQSSTAKENLLLSLRHKLLHEIAKQHGYTKVLVGDNATRLAVRLLGNIAQGRGASLPLDTGFADARDHDVIFARPLREFPSNEVAMYMALNNLKTVTIPSLTTLTSDKGSLEQLTESFIAGLQADFPSTINTIFRTGDKLQVGSSGGEAGLTEKHSCSLCQAPLDEVDDEAVFTHLKVPDGSSPTLWNNLCYGCRLTMKDVKSGVNLLPPFVHTAVPVDSIGDQQQHRSREAMRDQIQEYLLDDS